MKQLFIFISLLLASIAQAESIFVTYWGGNDSSATISMQSKSLAGSGNEMKIFFEHFKVTPEDIAGRVLIKEFRNFEGDIAFMCRLTKLIQQYHCSIDVLTNAHGKISKAEGYVSYVVEGAGAAELYKIFNAPNAPFSFSSTDGLGKGIQILSSPTRFALKYTEQK
ncbi:MAG: hypothetical protein AB7F59_06230 [Bdellovibrionales bacterium]